MHVRCPHCSHRIEIVDDDPLQEVQCPSCHSSFGLMPDPSETEAAPPSHRIGHFELVQQVGRGSFGSVWKAIDKELDRFVAIKLPRHELLRNSDAGQFLREARAAAQLRHPNLVSIHEVGRNETGQLYIVSDFIEGATLADWVQVKPLAIPEAVELVILLADAIQHAHDHLVIHRDLKPHNILMDAQGVPHIADFGLAKRESVDVTMTAEGRIVGTPAYMSPEQAAGRSSGVDARSDVYSLGVILFELLTHELPFRGSHQMLMLQILNDDPPSPRKFNAAVKRDLETICLKCLEKEPERRYQRASDLAADLQRFQRAAPISARPIGRLEWTARWCRRNPLVATLASGVVALVMVIVAGSVRYSLRVRQHAEEAETYFRMSLDAVDSMLREVGEESLANIPNAEPIRLKLLERALDFQKSLIESEPLNDGLRVEVARAQHRTGDIYELLGQFSASQKAYEEAIALFEQLRPSTSQHARVQSYLAISHNELGDLLRLNDPVAADTHFRRAKEIQQSIVQLDPSDHRNLRELNRTRNNLGLLLLETSRGQQAEEELREGIGSLETLITKLPGDVALHAECQGDLARMCINLGVLLRQQTGRFAEAEALYDRAIGLLEELVTRQPQDAEHRLKLGIAMLNLGNLVLKNGSVAAGTDSAGSDRAKVARKWFQRACDQFASLRDDFPGIPLYRRELVNSRNSLTAALFSMKDFPAARDQLDQAFEQLQQLASDFPQYVREVSECPHLRGVVLGGLGALSLEIDKDVTRADQLLDEAIVSQQAALVLSPSNAKYQERLLMHFRYRAKIQRELGDTTRASEYDAAADSLQAAAKSQSVPISSR